MTSPTDNRGLFARIADVYHTSKKDQDIFVNVFIARPVAAVLVAILEKTPATPNQVTILGVGIFAVAAAVLGLVPGLAGLVAGTVLLELAYVFDKADGQLARRTGKTSEVGSYFDFLMDEVKALLLVGAMSVRGWQSSGDDRWLLTGLGGAVLIAIATALTNFIRRPQYAGEEIKPGESSRQPGMPAGVVPKVMWLVRKVASFIAHYPSWFPLLLIPYFVGPVPPEAWFLGLYLGVHILYVGQTGLGVVLRLASPRFYD